MKVYLHVNYYEGPGKLATLLEIVSRNNYDGVELRGKYRFADMDQQQYQDMILKFKQSNPGHGFVFQSGVDMFRDQSIVDKEIDEYISFLNWAVDNLGVTVMNFSAGTLIPPNVAYNDYSKNGSGMADESHYERAARGLRIIGDAAAARGVTVALETHNCCLHDTAESSKKLMDLTNHDAIGINYDHGNIYIHPKAESIAKVFELLGPKIYYTHLKNLWVIKGEYIITHLDQGPIDTFDIVKRLKEQGYAGILTVEYPCSGDGVIAAKRDKEYVDYIKGFLGIK